MNLRRNPSRRTRMVAAMLCLAPMLLPAGHGATAAPAPAPAPAAPAPAQPAPAGPATLTPEQIFRKASPAVVLIEMVNADGKGCLGSGFVVSTAGVIVTNHHVVTPSQCQGLGDRLTVKLPRGDVFTDARVIYAEQRRDFAVLSIKAAMLPTIPVGDSDKIEPGNQVVAIGNPLGLELSFTAGFVSAVRVDQQRGYTFIQHQAPISHGNSGGPLLNMRGEVIGINTFSIGSVESQAQNINGAIPINYVKPFFGDPAAQSWDDYARANRGQPPAAGAPARPAPPSAASPWPTKSNFEKVSHYKSQPEAFRNGWAAAVYEAVALFAGAAGSGGIDKQQAQALYDCLDSKGDKSTQVRDWISGVLRGPSPQDPVATVIARACNSTFVPTKFFWRVSGFLSQNSSFTIGYAAGLFDGVSLAAAAVDGGDADARVRGLFECLDAKGDKLGELRTWMDSAVVGAATDAVAAGVVAAACQR